MINEITQSISPITPLPGLLSEDRPAAVNTLVEEELPQNSIEMQSLVGQVNTFIGQTNATADEVLANATLASNAATVAVANANYKGDWVAGFNTTGYSLGMSVTYTDGYNYSSKINNNLTEPTTLQNTTEWNFIESVNPNNYYLKTEIDSITSINNKTDKATPLDTDNFMIQEAGGSFKKLSWSNIKATLKTYFDTLYGKIVLGTFVNSNSGTAIDFTGIPSWVKKITIMLDEVGTNGSSIILIRLGSTTISTTGYIANGTALASSSTATLSSSSGFPLDDGKNTTFLYSGKIDILNIYGNKWVCNGSGKRATNASFATGGISPALSDKLDRIRITTANGTDQFNAGTINIIYEG